MDINYHRARFKDGWRVWSLLRSRRYRYASTMPDAPHSYTLRKWWDDEGLFEQVVRFIRWQGRDGEFRGRQYTYWHANGFKFWSMGAPVEETTVLNVDRSITASAYDKVADVYDSFYEGDEFTEEERAALSIMGVDGNGSLLDVGCGTGVLLKHVQPHEYVGIDVSRGMLSHLRRHHPFAQVHCCRVYDLYYPHGFDMVVAMFGVANYMTRDELKAAIARVRPGGRYAFMFYADGYRPHHIHDIIGDVQVHDHDIESLPFIEEVVPLNERHVIAKGRVPE